MNEHEQDSSGFNRRDFLRSGSVATMMAMMGGVELLSQPDPAKAAESAATKVKVGVIGLGMWGRQIVTTLGGLGMAEAAAICDTYPSFLKRAANLAPGATQTDDYKTILDNKDITAVIIATPSHKHKDIVLAALKAGKHVYCEAPLANAIEDAREIALAGKAARQVVFQPGLQVRCDPQRHFLLPFVRSGALGKTVMARAQWHKKQSWRTSSSNPEMNWRLSNATSLGLIGEIGIHQIDQASWFLNGRPVAITGFSSLALWNKDNFEAADDRDVPDTVQAVLEFPGGVRLNYDATLANSFESDFEIYHGSNAAVMFRENKAWMFKENDSPLFDWEVYPPKTTCGAFFEGNGKWVYKDTGISLIAGFSKPPPAPPPGAKAAEEPPYTQATLAAALEVFLRNAGDVDFARANTGEIYKDDPQGLVDYLATEVVRRKAPGFLEGFQATVLAIKANEAVLGNKRVELKPDLFELG